MFWAVFALNLFKYTQPLNLCWLSDAHRVKKTHIAQPEP